MSTTLEEAAKTVSKDMPSVVSFAASTAHSLLSSLQTVESSVIRASSMVASSLRSLPDVAERQFSLAPSASPEGESGAWLIEIRHVFQCFIHSFVPCECRPIGFKYASKHLKVAT